MCLFAEDEISILSIAEHIYIMPLLRGGSEMGVRAMAHSQQDAWKINVYIIQKRCENKGSNVKNSEQRVKMREKIEENQEIESTRP